MVANAGVCNRVDARGTFLCYDYAATQMITQGHGGCGSLEQVRSLANLVSLHVARTLPANLLSRALHRPPSIRQRDSTSVDMRSEEKAQRPFNKHVRAHTRRAVYIYSGW
ncbi:hypothetical protein L210DRAFT_996530 [Boletus edulis BED1]|uniref:Uncharacterized protein n=1 Tax=Boletus edulis BED1 TaxID=1328754 RepID=A0AAD4BZT0_BOLED|nr:hypothetical protein L210DRAFT_996530 [Boletus edulis BED1]